MLGLRSRFELRPLLGVVRKCQSPSGPLKVTVSEGFLEEVTLKGAGERGGEGRQGAGNHLEEGAGGDMQRAQQERPVTPGRSHQPLPPRRMRPVSKATEAEALQATTPFTSRRADSSLRGADAAEL